MNRKVTPLDIIESNTVRSTFVFSCRVEAEGRGRGAGRRDLGGRTVRTAVAAVALPQAVTSEFADPGITASDRRPVWGRCGAGLGPNTAESMTLSGASAAAPRALNADPMWPRSGLVVSGGLR